MPTDVAMLPVLEALERELALHRELLAATGAGTYRLDLVPPLARDLPDEAQVDGLLRRARFGAANDAMAALHGCARGEDLIGLGLGELVDTASPATRQAALGFLRCGCRYRDIETPVVDRAGRRRILLHSAVGVLESGALVAIWGTQRDLTEERVTLERLRHAEEERRRLEREMQEAQRLEALGVLAGGVAHDFNNLLTGIQGYAELARRRVEPASALAPLLDEILVGARRAGELTQKMLAFAGGAKLEIVWLGLNEVVTEMAELARVALPARGSLELELARPGPGLEADATQIRQVAMNLLINAAEAIAGGEGRIRVATGEVWCERARLDRATGGRERPEGRYAFLSVADDGCGMPEPVRARIFDPFFSTKFTGRGLGLAAVLGIVRAHRGAIEVESAADRGSVFTVLLPLALAGGRPIER